MIQWKIYKEKNIANVLMSSEQTQNGCLNYALKWGTSKNLKEAHLLMKSVLPFKNLILLFCKDIKKDLLGKSIKGYIEQTTLEWSCFKVNIRVMYLRTLRMRTSEWYSGDRPKSRQDEYRDNYIRMMY